MELRKFIATTIREYLNEQNLSNKNTIGLYTEIIFKNNLPTTKDIKAKAKIDTGATTNSIHCNKSYIKNGVLFCDILSSGKISSFSEFEIKSVKTSNGVSEDRYCVNLSFVLNTKEYKSIFTLNDRSEMEYPVLIGKNFLKDNEFSVNCQNV